MSGYAQLNLPKFMNKSKVEIFLLQQVGWGALGNSFCFPQHLRTELSSENSLCILQPKTE